MVVYGAAVQTWASPILRLTIMPIVYFLGTVLPETVKVTVSKAFEADWPAKDIGLEMHFTLNIENSEINVACEVNRWESDCLVHVYKRAVDMAQSAVNLASFASGFGTTIHMHTVVTPNGEKSAIQHRDDYLPSLVTAFKTGDPNFEQIWGIVATDPALFMALDDLVKTLAVFHQTPINCGRVLDSLRKIVTPGIDRKQSWPIFRKNLQCSEDYLQLVTDQSTGPRHGDRSFISGDITTEIQRRTWTIMNRFLEFKKRGNQPLPESEFPLLK